MAERNEGEHRSRLRRVADDEQVLPKTAMAQPKSEWARRVSRAALFGFLVLDELRQLLGLPQN